MALLGQDNGNGGNGILDAGDGGLIDKTFVQQFSLNNIKREFLKFKKFDEEIIDIFRPPIQNFTQQNYTALSTDLNNSTFVNLGQAINTDTLFQPDSFEELATTTIGSQTFDIYRLFFHSLVDTLKNGKNLNDRKESWKMKAIKNKETLYDIDKLREFINTYYKGFNLFDTETTLTVVPVLRIQFRLYIERHGFPPGGCFESAKMTAIITELINEGLLEPIDLENFLESYRVQQQNRGFEPSGVVSSTSESGNSNEQNNTSESGSSFGDINTSESGSSHGNNNESGSFEENDTSSVSS